METHKIWYQFSNWLNKTFGKDLLGKWEYLEIGGKKIKFRSFNEYELSTRLCGYENLTKIEKYVKRYCPEIKIVPCDDAIYAGSILLLIPHPKHGITVMYIPQCTSIQNQFFLYKRHFNQLMKALKELEKISY